MGGRRTSDSPDGRARRAALALSLARGVGSARFRQLTATFGSAERALDAGVPPHERMAAEGRAAQVLEEAGRRGIAVVTASEARYPEPLRDLDDPPPVLFAIGSLAMLQPPVVAVVGTRQATAYGERVTREVAGALVRAGACVVSGLARGIDAAAHRAALESGGRTVAVLGTGVDVAYPAAHRALHARIARDGLLLSEELPGDRASAGSFPRRNRIIAALARVVIVVEAGARSGALITASHALELGRAVAAVPGPIDARQSAGTNELLRDGATVIATVADALALAGCTPPAHGERVVLTGDERAVWDALAAGPQDADTLTARAALPARRCLAAITSLELSGAIECALTGEIRRR